MSEHPAVAVITRQRVVAVIRGGSAPEAVALGRALLRAGLRALEVSLTTPDAMAAIEQLAAELPAGGCLGAGTVLGTQDVRAVAAAGASFVVAPNTEPAVIDEAASKGLATIPAAATPTEMTTAHRHGADLIKLFPASLWTPAALRDVRVALPHLRLVPTGGITVAAAPDWIRAGGIAVGLGSALTRGDQDELTARGAALLADLAAAAS